MRRRHRALVLLTVAAAACSSSKTGVENLPPELRTAKVQATQDPAARLAHVRSYAWMAGSGLHRDARIDTPQVDRMLRQAIENALGEKGLRLAVGGQPDLLIGYVATVESQIDEATVDRLHGVSPGGFPRFGDRIYDKGMMIVDALDPATRRPVWRGAIEVRASFDLDEQTRRERFEHLTRLLFDRFDLSR